MALDFNETYMKRLNESFDLIANGVQYTWPGVGGMTIMNGVFLGTAAIESLWRRIRWSFL